MKCSVLIPVYNVEAYLEACIHSVLEQTYQNYEIVLVDDGSSDRSAEICDRFAKTYPDKVKVTHKENEGVLVARNEAIRQATGNIVVFLDADDCLRRDALMRIYMAFEKHQCDMIIYNCSTNSDFGSAYQTVPLADDACIEAEEKKQLYSLLCDVSYLNGLCFKAVKKEIADILLTHPEWSGVTNGEDLLCTLPLVTNAEKIVYLDQVLYYYRQRPGSAVHTFKFNRLQSIKTVHKEFEKYIDLWQMPELHSRHYAREVKGWIESLMLMASNRKTICMERLRQELRSMANDPYFRNAWEKMERSYLEKKYIILSNLLYDQRIGVVSAICVILRLFIWGKEIFKA